MRTALLLLALLALPAAASAQDCVTVDNFAKGKVGEFPPDWKPRKDSGREVYSIQEMDGLRFLHALAKEFWGLTEGKEINRRWISNRRYHCRFR